MKRYQGKRTEHGGCVVTVQRGSMVQAQLLPPRLDIRNHSPTGFEWGYGGSGPAQLALAILANLIGAKQAEMFYQSFKRQVVSRFPHEGWELTADEIYEWIQTQEVTIQ